MSVNDLRKETCSAFENRKLISSTLLYEDKKRALQIYDDELTALRMPGRSIEYHGLLHLARLRPDWDIPMVSMNYYKREGI